MGPYSSPRGDNAPGDPLFAQVAEQALVGWPAGSGGRKIRRAEQKGSIRDVSLQHVDVRIEPSPRNEACGGNFDLRPAGEDRDTLFAHDIPGLCARGVEGLRIHDFTLEWADGLPAFFTNGIQCEQCSNVSVDGFAGRQAHADDSTAAIGLRQVESVTIRNCVAPAGTGSFLSESDSTDVRVFGNDLSRAAVATRPSETR